jgi:hypothetical protein
MSDDIQHFLAFFGQGFRLPDMLAAGYIQLALQPAMPLHSLSSRYKVAGLLS